MMTKTIPRERLPALQKSYDQLCEWLNYDANTRHSARRLLDGRYIKPFFREYRRDFLEASHGHGHQTVQCADLYRWCMSKDAFVRPEYAGSDAQLNKEDWAPLDHAARFLVRVLRFSWENNGEWDSGKFDPNNDEGGEGDLEFYQVWAILQYLQAEWEAANVDDWEMERLAGIFTETMVSRL
ncbi:hypothetical protein SAMD00023353_4900510 [Rosellinia necatrix]|uniref:Uncharacterized protein n=1 Tax=Rosellinia necatrix TaxID=77044 RepID=A0A1W2TPP8_ROSNE|nr:hypothetical protein SAMD00023353_4900510 [Rosellinia necatrix]